MSIAEALEDIFDEAARRIYVSTGLTTNDDEQAIEGIAWEVMHWPHIRVSYWWPVLERMRARR